jgi:hypothetical protein
LFPALRGYTFSRLYDCVMRGSRGLALYPPSAFDALLSYAKDFSSRERNPTSGGTYGYGNDGDGTNSEN